MLVAKSPVGQDARHALLYYHCPLLCPILILDRQYISKFDNTFSNLSKKPRCAFRDLGYYFIAESEMLVGWLLNAYFQIVWGV